MLSAGHARPRPVPHGQVLGGGININICIDINNEAFCLMSHAAPHSADHPCEGFGALRQYSVRLKHIAIMSGAGASHRPQPAFYPLEREDVQAYNIPACQNSFQKNDLFLGKIPRGALVGPGYQHGLRGHQECQSIQFPVVHSQDPETAGQCRVIPRFGHRVGGERFGERLLFLDVGRWQHASWTGPTVRTKAIGQRVRLVHV